ncbi:MAG: Crp/Fnr family transcriptional regulator [Nitrospirae bacterium]|nr:Crp/Fnr family transcriptional regulator [Nitrospirota bacterium]
MENTVVTTLSNSRLFGHLGKDDLADIAPAFKLERFGGDEYIFAESDRAERLYLVCEGRVKIVKHTPEGKDVILEVIDPPEIFGGVAVLDGRPYPASALTMEESAVISINRKGFFELIDRYHVLALEATIYFGERLRNAYDMLKAVAVERVERRIASLLFRFGERLGTRSAKGEIVMEMGLTMQEIAEMVGTTVETTIRTMNKFKKEGLIQYGQGRTVLYPGLREKLPVAE